MNPLTLVKRIQKINQQEAALGISEQASWHAKYNDSAYVFVGGIPFQLTEGDLLAIFAQYGEIVDVNLVKDKGTGKSKGFAFVAYEDQRSTNLAVDNLNGAQVLGRTIRVDHCSKYRKLEEEDPETTRQKREERGVCRAFQKGQCNRGDSCKFSHDEKRAANTGWGAEEDRQSKWANDKFDDPRKAGPSRQSSRNMKNDGSSNKDLIEPRRKDDGLARDRRQEGTERKSRDQGSRDIEKRAENGKGRSYEEELDRPHANRKSRWPDGEHVSGEDRDKREGKRLKRSDSESLRREEQESREGHRKRAYERDPSPRRRKMNDDEPREDHENKRDEKRTTRYESDSNQREERDLRGGVKRSDYGRDSSPRHRRTDEDRGRRSHR
ncbi:hypothetical protein LIER_20274 [Lithospermum erythrorhizon]|uniref:Uncharacterized protein n=1 Tax=Lithospermum erythrorhizon TaxID=34254 RepID=A0AAV3QQ18_LITER